MVGHSLFTAALLALPAAGLLAAVAGWRYRARLALCFGSFALHDALDMAQGSDRAPLWPLHQRPMRLGVELIPSESTYEAIMFAAMFGVFLVMWRRHRGRAGVPAPRPVAATWTARSVTAAILLAALATHQLRATRERTYRRAARLVNAHQYAVAIPLLDAAERWPAAGKPGRLDYIRAEALVGLGNRQEAERYYLRSLEADPDYFWLLADLGAFYAGADLPRAERERLTAPYVERLRRDFSRQRDLEPALSRIERKLLEPPESPAVRHAPAE
jgi:membrane-bound metal-dependent hydrolase YbcI (DUF457 family)